MLKRVLSGNSLSNFTKNMNNSDLVDSVDEQLMQIREKLAKFREQDQWRSQGGARGGICPPITKYKF